MTPETAVLKRSESLPALALRRACGVLSLVFLGLFFVGLTLEFGVWQAREEFRGPFATETSDNLVITLRVGSNIGPRWLVEARSDNPSREQSSDLKLFVTGHEWTTPHALHEQIRVGSTGIFSHWNGYLYFSLPPGLPNDQTTVISVSYSVRVRLGIMATFAAVGTLSAVAFVVIAYGTDERLPERIAVLSTKILFALFWFGSAAIFFSSAFYAATVVWGWIRNDALPTAFIIRTMGVFAHIWDKALFVSHAMFAVAATGSLLAWLMTASASAKPIYERRLQGLCWVWKWAAFPVLSMLMLFLLSGGGWAGRYSPYEMHYMSLGGLVPYSDARVYYAAPFESVYGGSWNAIAAQRPLAAAFRSLVVLLGGYSYTGALVAQALLVSLAIVVSSHSVARSYGPWIALGFAALALGLARPFLMTMMTESLGLIWGLVALALFLESFRLRSPQYAFVAFWALCLGLFTRTGSLVTIAGVALWITLNFGDSARRRLCLLAATIAVLLIALGFNQLVATTFASKTIAGTGNFAYVICGLSRGTNWQECAMTFAAQLATLSFDPNAQNAFLWKVAINEALAKPSVLLTSLFETMQAYVENIPRFFVVQYTTLFWPTHAFIQNFLLLLLPGWIYFVTRRNRRAETGFFIIVLASVIVSSAFVFRDDGGRVLTVTHVFVAMILMLGLANPAMPDADDLTRKGSWRVAAITVASLASLLFIAPIAILERPPTPPEVREQIDTRARSILVLPAPALTGFLVQPEASALRHDIPSMHQSTLEAIFKQTNIEKDLGPFISEITTRIPVALVYAPRIANLGPISVVDLYIAPAEVLTTTAVKGWRFEVEERPEGKSHPVSIVKLAIPIR